jgi:pyruvate kinase
MKNQKRTKIIATLGPATESPEMIEKLIEAGANVFRFNMKQADVDWHDKAIKKANDIAKKMGKTVGTFIDLQGPELRLETKDKEDVLVGGKEEVKFSLKLDKDPTTVSVPNKAFFEAINKGDVFLIDDGLLEFTVTKKSKDSLYATTSADCVIKHRKGLNLPGIDIELPSLIKDDLERLDMAGKNNLVDFVGLSFARSKKDIQVLRKEMDKRGIKAQIVAKIENQKAIQNIDEIIEYADGIMFARGDLGIEVPVERLAYYQRNIIKKCRIARKPVIVATQMLESMSSNSRPTRAEVTDVANAVFYGTDAIMLSGETAIGKYPVEAVETMTSIALFNEKKAILYDLENKAKNPTELIVYAANAMTESDIRIDAFVVFTESGYTASVLSSLRPMAPIIAVTDQEKTVEYSTLSYGVVDFCKTACNEKMDRLDTIENLKKEGILSKGDNIVMIHGTREKYPELTNSIMLMNIQ